MSEEKTFDEMNKYQLKKLVKKLEDIRGRNTELVSLYIPAGYDMSKISEFVTSESSEAENIKSKHTRKNVKAALDKISRKVKEEPVTPENGVVFFAGNVSERREGLTSSYGRSSHRSQSNHEDIDATRSSFSTH